MSLTSFTSSFGPSAAAAGTLSSLIVGDADAPFGADDGCLPFIPYLCHATDHTHIAVRRDLAVDGDPRRQGPLLFCVYLN